MSQENMPLTSSLTPEPLSMAPLHIAPLNMAMYQPDMPQNCGAVMRLCACFGVPLHLIEPLGFVWDEARVRRVAMDYIQHVNLSRHANWESFRSAVAVAPDFARAVVSPSIDGGTEQAAYNGAEQSRQAKLSRNGRIILLSTKAATPYDQFQFQAGDCLLLGRESAGVPEYVHGQVDARVVIPLQNGMRSLNVGMSAAIVLSEATRQLKSS